MPNTNNIDPKAFREFEHSGWEKVVDPYHTHFGSLTNQVTSALLKSVHARKGIKLLDIATGPGYVASAAEKLGASVVAIDFSKPMVAKAKKEYPTIRFQVGDAEVLSFADNTFDAVTINFGVLHFSRPEVALAEAYRVLRLHGRIGFTVWAKPDDALGFSIVLNAIKEHGTLDVALPPGPPFFRFSDSEESKKIMQEVGFKNPSVKKVSLIWRLASAELLFTAFWEGTGRTGPLMRAQKPEALKIIRQKIENAVNAYSKNGRIEIPMPAMLVSAVK